ncbi:ribosomal RNA small subunit methyltransferase nep-1-like [Coffea eugenioides]|uniref:ribosomal RNA small subunit methyltransferase nep-1-like n=1 Tax=Coffea eugenioides TaxID=49369 RepID=UPI000F60A456|nr:ribosomal RNA small subunit methyltransferase nep-1-like [Coffea eugenioides]
MHEEFRNVSETSTDIPGIPLAPSIKNSKPGVIFVLEKALLVPAYVGRTYEILNPDKHADFMRKKNMNPYDYRPDIIHEVLVDILGSRLNMAGMVKASPSTLDKHSPLCVGTFTVHVLQPSCCSKFSIKARGKGEKANENPLDKHLPLNSLKIGLCFSSSKAVNLRDYVTTINNDCTPVFIIGAMAHGKIDTEHTDDLTSVSSLPLSACLSSILGTHYSVAATIKFILKRLSICSIHLIQLSSVSAIGEGALPDQADLCGVNPLVFLAKFCIALKISKKPA